MSEFARPIDVDRLPPEGTLQEIAASAVERAALARRFDLVSLDRLEAAVRLEPLAGGLLRLSATLSAEIVQACVATLEPVASRIEESFTLLYGQAQDSSGEITLSGEAELVEPLGDRTVDIGEAVAQQLSLAIDPFPRAAGSEAARPEAPAAKADSPFAALAKWKQKG